MTKNTPEYFAIGSQAGQAFNSADKQTDKGLTLAIVAMMQAFPVFEFDYTVIRKTDKDGEPTEQDESKTATIRDLFTTPSLPNGSNDGKANAQRLAAFARELFGMDELTPAQNTNIRRAISVVHYLVHINAEASLDKGKLTIPFHAVYDAPNSDAEAHTKVAFEATKDLPVAIDGKDGRSLNALMKRGDKVLRDAGLVNKTSRKGKKAKAGESMQASISFLNKSLPSVLSDDESDVALTTANRKALFELQQTIAAIFAADPIEDEGETVETEAA